MTVPRSPPTSMDSSFVHLTFVLMVTFLFAPPLTPVTHALKPNRYHDYCVVGAGPAGLQMGYFLRKANRDYMIFERYNTSGHFFVTYPRHRTIISINKRNTGQKNKEFNLRHDWNSLLSDDESLRFTKYSKDLFPHADRLVDYFRDFQQKLGLKVQFNTNVSNIHTVRNTSAPDGLLHVFNDQHGQQYTCKVLVMATGMWKPNIPEDIEGIELVDGYEDMSVDPEDYEGKSVLIMGHGNSAFETAQDIYGHTNLVHMIARSRVRLSWQTHYVGDVRAVNMDLVDTYQLKSLDAVAEGGFGNIKFQQVGDKLEMLQDKEMPMSSRRDNDPAREPYDVVIRCLGFTFDESIFRDEVDMGVTKKYLPIRHNYESIAMPGVFVAGAASHSLDFRKSAGGFIHGFRYTARALSRLLEWRYEGVPWPSRALGLPVIQLMNVLMKRLNEASGPYQMVQVLGDVVVFSEDGTRFDYYEEFPIKLLHDFPKHTGRSASRILAVVLQYGPDFSSPGKDTLARDRSTLNPDRAHTSNFLHPVLYYYPALPTEEQMKNLSEKEVLPQPSAIHHVVEDFLTRWEGPKSHGAPLRHFLENVLSSDLRYRFGQDCFLEAMTRGRPSQACSDHYLQGQGLTALPSMVELPAKQPENKRPPARKSNWHK